MAFGVREYVESLNSLLNRSITLSRLTALTVRGSTRAVVTRRLQGAFVPLELNNGWLRFEQEIVSRGDHAGDVAHALYIYYRGRTLDEQAWVFRYEYDDPSAATKPHSHLHVNGMHPSSAGDLSRIHFPCGAMRAEQVIWLLINEFGARSLSDVSDDLRRSFDADALHFGQGSGKIPFP